VWLDPELALDNKGLCLRNTLSGSSGCVHSFKSQKESQEFNSYQSLVNLAFTE